MRIKCPNSEIILELPGDKPDMKFTCPACHKVHRVTVSITTPGEDAPQNAHSIMRSQPAMPKKYATGAYAPVVDIPIDANFVLLDGSSPLQQGIDLGAAAPKPPSPPPPPPPPPPPDPAGMSARKTEAMPRDGRPRANDAAAEASSTIASDDDGILPSARDHVRPGRKTDEPPAGASAWERGAADAPRDGARDSAPSAAPAEEAAYAPRPGRGRNNAASGGVLRGMLFLLLLAALAAAGYLLYQRSAYNEAREETEGLLETAETSLRQFDIPASARSARAAQAVLDNAETLFTPAKAYNAVALATGLLSPAPEETGDARARIRAFLSREERLNAFGGALDASSAETAAGQLRDASKRLAEDAQRLTPERARARAYADAAALRTALSPEGTERLENELSSFLDRQRRRMADEVKEEIAGIARDAARGAPQALGRYRALAARTRDSGIPEFGVPPATLGDDAQRPVLEQLATLSDVVDRAVDSARTALTREEEDDDRLFDSLADEAKKITRPNPAMADAAAKLIDDTRAEADELLNLRVEVFSRMQSEMRRNREYTGTKLAWSMLRMAFGDPRVAIEPAAFRFDSGGSAMRFSFGGVPGSMEMREEDYEQRVRATVGGYGFTAGWALLFHRPVAWMAKLAREMKNAGIDPARYPAWEVLEGPEGPIALSLPGASGTDANASLSGGEAERRLFFSGRLLPARELPRPDDTERLAGDFRREARRLEEAVMAEESIPQPLRQALKPVLAGTHEQPDPRDYFDSAFCRRLIEADYLETNISPMPREIRSRLESYRRALEKLESGYDEFSVDLGDGRTLFATARPGGEGGGSTRSGDQDPETGETLPRYTWRVETGAATVFHSPQPARFIYSFMLAEHYDGRHAKRPAGVPVLTEVRHATKGVVASYRNGAGRAEGDALLWDEAIAEDSSGRFDPSVGPPGWNYPLHVLQRDDQGDPVLLATLSGVVESPDFSVVADGAARRAAEDEWLSDTAETLSTPGELGLIFHQFFRYCSDSPLPERPNLIGSHFGLSDTHQTVYQSLERRWVGRLIGDCDDLAEFFQVLTRRQGKLSHVMQLPAHAAAGYVERTPEEQYRFIVLQTGPVMQFTAPTLNEAVELAYRSFDRGEGISHMTTDAVPLLLRFADEETRTPFVLSARIYEDAAYADTMIRVQSYWHEHIYSAAIGTMEKMVETDKEIGSIKELGSLYERVGFYDRSETLRRTELEMVRDNPQATMSTLLEIVQLHLQERNREKALAALGEMEEVMLRMIRSEDAPEFFRNMTFRSYWAMFLSRLGEPARAWKLVRYDVAMTKRQLGRVAEPVLRTLVLMYERMGIARDRAGGSLEGEGLTAMEEVRKELEEAFYRGYFTADDSYNGVIGKYFFMGRFAVSDAGREEGLSTLRLDGPYPDAPKDQTKRARGIDSEDWSWFRITPQLYYALGTEMLDRGDFPDLYDPEAARPLLEDVSRAVERGTGLGSDVAGGDTEVSAALTLSFLNNDLAAFRRAMARVLEKNYSSLYDDAALTFGLNCGFVPLADFSAWAEAFREFFPGKQHYFKVVYRAIDKGHYDHALVMAEATARFFPDEEMLVREAAFVRSIIPGLKSRQTGASWN